MQVGREALWSLAAMLLHNDDDDDVSMRAPTIFPSLGLTVQLPHPVDVVAGLRVTWHDAQLRRNR